MRTDDVTDELVREAARRWHTDPLFHARATLTVRLMQRAHPRRIAGPAEQAAREAACLALVLAETDMEELANRPDPADAQLRHLQQAAPPISEAVLRELRGHGASEGDPAL